MRLAERTVLNASSKIASDLSYLVVSLESSESAASLWVYSVSLEQGPHWLCLPQTATYLINRVLSPQGHGLLMNLTVKQGPCCLRQMTQLFSLTSAGPDVPSSSPLVYLPRATWQWLLFKLPLRGRAAFPWLSVQSGWGGTSPLSSLLWRDAILGYLSGWPGSSL